MKFFYKKDELEKLRELIKSTSEQIIIIAGPTASGKSDIAIKLAQEFNGVIINADSRQVYKEIEIGTASPIPEKISTESFGNFKADRWSISDVNHYLYGYKSIFDRYTLVDYQKDLQNLIENIKSRYDKIFIVGGTGLFIDAFVYNYNLDKEIDDQFENYRTHLNTLTVGELQELIGEVKLLELNESDRKNQYRLIRFLEKGMQKYELGEAIPHLYTVLSPTITELEPNIILRTENMFNAGLLEENIKVRELEKEMKKESAIHKIIGYKEFDSYFLAQQNLEKNESENEKTKEKQVTLETVKAEIILRTRQYAKRQITWFKRLTE